MLTSLPRNTYASTCSHVAQTCYLSYIVHPRFHITRGLTQALKKLSSENTEQGFICRMEDATEFFP